MRRKFVLNNELLEGIVYKTTNIVMQKIQEGRNRRKCYIIGNGHSLSVNDDNRVIKHDPLMHIFQPKIDKDVTVYAFYFTFESSGLADSSKEIAYFVNELLEDYDQIYLIGHSKCGVCVYDASYYCERDIILVTISAPFKGTVIADKNRMEAILKFPLFIKFYRMIFSDHNVDKDIIPNSHFLQNMKPAIYEEHFNIVSSFRGIASCRGLLDFGLILLDKIMKIHGDGVVSYSSQQIRFTPTIEIFCSHANSLKKGLQVVEEQIW